MRLCTLTTRLDYDFMSSGGKRSLGGPGSGLVQVSEDPRDALRRHVCCYNVQVFLFHQLTSHEMVFYSSVHLSAISGGRKLSWIIYYRLVWCERKTLFPARNL